MDIYKTGSLKIKQDVPSGYQLDLCYTCEGGSGVNKYSIEYDNIKIIQEKSEKSAYLIIIIIIVVVICLGFGALLACFKEKLRNLK